MAVGGAGPFGRVRRRGSRHGASGEGARAARSRKQCPGAAVAAERCAPQDTKGATFMQLDAACSPLVSAKATSGVVRLSTPEVKLGGTTEGTFELTMGGDKLGGRFVAAFCQQPDMEPRGCR